MKNSTIKNHRSIRGNIKLKWHAIVFISIALVPGCFTTAGYYSPAEVIGRTISNPKIGWSGYTIEVPSGCTIFSTSGHNATSSNLSPQQRGLIQYENMQSRVYPIKFIECFLISDSESKDVIVFSNENYDLKPWATLGSVELTYFLNKSMRRKKVLINDTSSEGNVFALDDKKGWQLSGTLNSDGLFGFGSDESIAYEGIFRLGGLNEAYWFEGFGPVENRKQLRQKVHTIAESLNF